jgi:hypothetical protein
MNAKRQAQNDLHESEMEERDTYWRSEGERRQEVWVKEREAFEITTGIVHAGEVLKLQDGVKKARYENLGEVRRLQASIKTANQKIKEQRMTVYFRFELTLRSLLWRRGMRIAKYELRIYNDKSRRCGDPWQSLCQLLLLSLLYQHHTDTSCLINSWPRLTIPAMEYPPKP